MRKTSTIILLSALVLALTLGAVVSSLAFPAANIGQEKLNTIVIDVFPGRPYSTADLADLKGNLTAMGYTVIESTGRITATVLGDNDALLIPKIMTSEGAFTSSELSAITAWFNKGKKFLWVGSDSDYHEGIETGRDFNNEETNKALAAVGSVLRVDFCSIEDPESNAGAAYRTVAPIRNTAHEDAAEILTGISKVMFHGPTMVVGFKDGSLVPFSEVESDNVFWIMKTSASAPIVDNSPQTPPATGQVGDTGSFVMAAAEKRAGPDENCKVVATAEAMYGKYGLRYDFYSDVELQGVAFVNQVIEWGMTVDEAPTGILGLSIEIWAVIIVVIVIIVAAALFFMRRK